jgi:hypothetical protein
MTMPHRLPCASKLCWENKAVDGLGEAFGLELGKADPFAGQEGTSQPHMSGRGGDGIEVNRSSKEVVYSR